MSIPHRALGLTTLATLAAALLASGSFADTSLATSCQGAMGSSFQVSLTDVRNVGSSAAWAVCPVHAGRRSGVHDLAFEYPSWAGVYTTNGAGTSCYVGGFRDSGATKTVRWRSLIRSGNFFWATFGSDFEGYQSFNLICFVPAGTALMSYEVGTAE